MRIALPTAAPDTLLMSSSSTIGSEPRALHLIGGFLEFRTVARNEHHAGEIQSQPDGGGPANALAGTGNDCDCILHGCLI
jgi:hypothetical protein